MTNVPRAVLVSTWVLLAVAACATPARTVPARPRVAAAARPTAAAPRTEAAAPEAPQASGDGVATAARDRPRAARQLRVEPDLVVHPRGVRPRIRSIARASGAHVSRDHSVILIHTLGGIWRHGADLRRERPVLVPTDRSAVERIALSPDGTWVAAAVRGSRVVVVDPSDGRVLRSIDGPDIAVALGAVSPRQLVFQRGCGVFLLDVRGDAEPQRIGPQNCTPLTYRGHRNGAAWFVAGISFFGLEGLLAVDLATGGVERLLETRGDGLLQIAVAEAGSRVCWTQRGAAGGELFCADEPRAEPWHVATGIAEVADLAVDGERLLYVTADDDRRDVVLVDFPSATARRVVAASPYEWWTFLPGSRRIVGHGAQNGAQIIDLAEGWSLHVGGRREEWEDVYTIPDDGDHFFIRREPSTLQYVDLGAD